jgi:hypothetical protein
MDAIEKENPSLRDVLPKVYARGNLDPTSLGGLIDLVGNIALGDAKARSADVLGHVFEYFLGEFALAEGKKGGQFYTPASVVELLVEMLEPTKAASLTPAAAPAACLCSRRSLSPATRAGQRHLHLRAGEQPDHLAAGQDEPRHPRASTARR